jgi:hypothetical protein
MRRFVALLAALTVPALPSVGNTQVPVPVGASVPDGTLGIELSVIEPRGDFRPGHTLSLGYGLRGAANWGPRRAFDVGLAYRSVAHDSKRYNDTLEVKNMLRTLALGVRYTLPLRYVRPYLGAEAGAAYFGTETTAESCCDDNGERERSLSSIRLARLAPMASTRLGLAIDLWRMRGPTPSTLSADLGLETHYGGRVTYQVGGRGDVRRTGTRYRVYSLGVSLRTR